MPTDKPLFLADEIAKIVRDNDPAAWLKDAEVALGQLAGAERAKRMRFSPKLEVGHGVNLALFGDGGWGVRALAHYSVRTSDPIGLQFIGNQELTKDKPDVFKRVDCIATEQDFIRHLLRVLRDGFGI